MYGLNTAKNLRALFAAAAAAAQYPIRLHRHNSTHSSCRRVVDEFVFVEKGYKICSKEEIEGPISNSRITKWNGSQKKLKKRTYKRKVLPPKLLSGSVVRLTCESTADGGICDVYLVGTDHCCEKSWREAQNVVNFLKPQVVYLELCSSRLYILTQRNSKALSEVRQVRTALLIVLTMREMLDMWKKKEDPFSILFKWFQAKLCSRNEIWIGGEFRAAYQEAMQYGGKVILGDVPVEITMRRILANMSAWRYLFHPTNVSIPVDLVKTAKDEKDRRNLRDQEMTKKFPTYWVPFMHERDQYMSAKLLKVARQHNSVVAVVGKDHLAGIQKYWKQPIDIKQLLDTRTHTVLLEPWFFFFPRHTPGRIE